MRPRRQLKAHWGLLLVVYWALLVPTALVVLTSQANVVPFLALLCAGVPIYFIAANTIVNRCETPLGEGSQAQTDESDCSNVVLFTGRGLQVTPLDIAHVPAGRRSHLRKTG